MTVDANSLLKRIRRQTVRYVYDDKGAITGIESPDGAFRITTAGTMQPGPAGKNGTDGENGTNGVKGADGSQTYFGMDITKISGMKSGDVFVNTATWDIYRYS